MELEVLCSSPGRYLSLLPRVLYFNRNIRQIISLDRVAVGHSGLDSTNRRFWPIFQHIFPKLLTRGDHFCNRKPYFFLSTWGGSCLCGAPDANARLTHSVKRSVSIESEQRTWRGVGKDAWTWRNVNKDPVRRAPSLVDRRPRRRWYRRLYRQSCHQSCRWSYRWAAFVGRAVVRSVDIFVSSIALKRVAPNGCCRWRGRCCR